MPRGERSVEDVSAEGPRAWQARARARILATIIAPAASRMIAVMGSFPFVAVGAPTGVDGATHVTVVAETLMYRDSGALPVAWRRLVNRSIHGGTYRGCALAGVGFASSRQRAFRQLRRRTLEQCANFLAGPTILGRRGLWKAMKQGRRSSDVLACPSEVREGPVVGEDPLVYTTGRGTCVPTISAMLDFLIDLAVLPN